MDFQLWQTMEVQTLLPSPPLCHAKKGTSRRFLHLTLEMLVPIKKWQPSWDLPGEVETHGLELKTGFIHRILPLLKAGFPKFSALLPEKLTLLPGVKIKNN